MKRTLVLEGLSCTNCAQKIEREVGKLRGVMVASIDFVTSKLTIDAEEELMEYILFETKRIVADIEPDVVVKGDQAETTAASSVGLIKKHQGLIRLILGAVIFLAAMLTRGDGMLSLLLYLCAWLVTGADILYGALRNLLRGRIMDENFLMTVASAGAFFIGEYPEAVVVIFLYKIGELFQSFAVDKSRKSIAELMNIRPDYCNLRRGEDLVTQDPREAVAGDVIVVKAGERVPLDSVITEGHSTLDVSALTGESLPLEAGPGDTILSGSVNLSGLLTAEVIREFGDSTASRIIVLVENAASKKSSSENFITRFARIYTPVVVAFAALLAFLPPLIIPGAALSDWGYRALTFLVISCPCSLVISVPLGFFGGIGGASRRGILVKGGNYLEALARTDTVVFDKTGTLTRGVFKVQQVNPAGVTEAELLRIAVLAESFSNHPIAQSLRNAAETLPDDSLVSAHREIPGMGLSAELGGETVLVGNGRLMESEGIDYTPATGVGTKVYVAVSGVFSGSFLISDELKPDAAETIDTLKRIGVAETVMMTGDSPEAAEYAAEQLHVDRVLAGLLPQDKVRELERILERQESKSRLVFVGDGINDAPVLARADVGVAMGGLGADAAIEAADVVIMTDEPLKIAEAIRRSRKTLRIVSQNIALSLAVKFLVLILGALGLASMWAAVFADVGVLVIAVFNSMRTLRE